MSLAPIILFAYNRPMHTKKLLDSLTANSEVEDSVLYIYCDGAKEDATPENIQKVQETRNICKTENRFKEIVVIEQPMNKGLTNSITEGVTEVVNRHGTVIVLEDDLILSPYFLHYMNDSLKRYMNHPKVSSIGACNFFACGAKYPKTFFIILPDCLGWATWQDRWRYFSTDASVLYQQLIEKNLLHKFNVYGSYRMDKLLIDQIEGKGTSWAVKWTAQCILNDWLTLYPNPSLTNHIESQEATNAATLNVVPPLQQYKVDFETIKVREIPKVIKALKRGYAGTGDYYGNLKRGFRIRLYAKLKSILGSS